MSFKIIDLWPERVLYHDGVIDGLIIDKGYPFFCVDRRGGFMILGTGGLEGITINQLDVLEFSTKIQNCWFR
jgi:hypothetical protein